MPEKCGGFGSLVFVSTLQHSVDDKHMNVLALKLLDASLPLRYFGGFFFFFEVSRFIYLYIYFFAGVLLCLVSPNCSNAVTLDSSTDTLQCSLLPACRRAAALVAV